MAPIGLYIFSGLPAVGKSTLSQRLARHLNACYLRIDTIEQGLREVCNIPVEGEGYRLAYRIAGDNLRLGHSVIADSCNPIALTRREWHQVAQAEKVPYRDIEVVCSDTHRHRIRVETRSSPIKGLVLPRWEQVLSREYHVRTSDVITIDTAHKTEQESLQALLHALASQ